MIVDESFFKSLFLFFSSSFTNLFVTTAKKKVFFWWHSVVLLSSVGHCILVFSMRIMLTITRCCYHLPCSKFQCSKKAKLFTARGSLFKLSRRINSSSVAVSSFCCIKSQKFDLIQKKNSQLFFFKRQRYLYWLSYCFHQYAKGSK